MVISEVIKNIRSQLSLSQEGLARELHMGFTSVNRWENNKSKPNQIARHAKYIYIDDPISSLDDNNVVALACQLSALLKDCKIKTAISTHHTLFFNVMYNELRKESTASRFLSFDKETSKYIVKATGDTPFFHHVALLKELKKVADNGKIYTYHFNVLRNVLEKTAAFHGFDNFSDCIKREDDDLDDVLFARMVNLLSHGNHSIFNPLEMVEDNKEIFRNILNRFLENYKFNDKLFTER